MYGGWYDRRDTRRESTRGLTSDLNSHYSETWEGRIDDYMSSEDEERYHELTRIRTTNNDAHNIV